MCRYLYELVVDPAYQRLGLASHLVKLMEAMVCVLLRLSDFRHCCCSRQPVTI